MSLAVQFWLRSVEEARLGMFLGAVRVKILAVRPVNRLQDLGKHGQLKGVIRDENRPTGTGLPV
jgi:hypothetical protein